MDPSECEMTHFVKQFIPKGTTKNTEWAKRLYQSYAVRKNKNSDIKSMDEAELGQELRKFYHELSKQDGKLYTQVALRGIRAGLQRCLRVPPNPSTINLTTGDIFAPANQISKNSALFHGLNCWCARKKR